MEMYKQIENEPTLFDKEITFLEKISEWKYARILLMLYMCV